MSVDKYKLDKKITDKISNYAITYMVDHDSFTIDEVCTNVLLQGDLNMITADAIQNTVETIFSALGKIRMLVEKDGRYYKNLYNDKK